MLDFFISFNKFISFIGICFWWEVDCMIDVGWVQFNGIIVKKGNCVNFGDEVFLDGVFLKVKFKVVYFVLYKFFGIICIIDCKDKDNIIDFFNYFECIFYIGCFDKVFIGLIFLINDGDIVNEILCE